MPITLQDFLLNARLRKLPKDQILVYEGDLQPEIYILKSGVVKIYGIDDQGEEKILHLLGTPAVIPLSFFSFIDTITTTWYYMTLTDCDVYVIPKNKLVSLIENNAPIAVYLVGQFYKKDVHEIMTHLASLEKTSTREKIRAILQYLVVCHTGKQLANDWHRISFPVSHQLLADMSGITRASTTQTMKWMVGKGIARYKKPLQLEVNSEKLQATR
jgi:CRP/FNR family transcriptional regulator